MLGPKKWHMQTETVIFSLVDVLKERNKPILGFLDNKALFEANISLIRQPGSAIDYPNFRQVGMRY